MGLSDENRALIARVANHVEHRVETYQSIEADDLDTLLNAAREEGAKPWRESIENFTYRSSDGGIYFSFREAVTIDEMLPDDGSSIHRAGTA